MDQTTKDAFACRRCEAVVTDKLDNEGNPIKLWVCENCGEENKVPTAEEQSAQAAIDAAATAPMGTNAVNVPTPPAQPQPAS